MCYITNYTIHSREDKNPVFSKIVDYLIYLTLIKKAPLQLSDVCVSVCVCTCILQKTPAFFRKQKKGRKKKNRRKHGEKNSPSVNSYIMLLHSFPIPKTLYYSRHLVVPIIIKYSRTHRPSSISSHNFTFHFFPPPPPPPPKYPPVKVSPHPFVPC